MRRKFFRGADKIPKSVVAPFRLRSGWTPVGTNSKKNLHSRFHGNDEIGSWTTSGTTKGDDDL
jgi:hypothetical protein